MLAASPKGDRIASFVCDQTGAEYQCSCLFATSVAHALFGVLASLFTARLGLGSGAERSLTPTW
jgi:hypothetical protein